jgi:hypothetical protein
VRAFLASFCRRHTYPFLDFSIANDITSPCKMLSPADPQHNYVLNVARKNVNQARLLAPALAPGNMQQARVVVKWSRRRTTTIPSERRTCAVC